MDTKERSAELTAQAETALDAELARIDASISNEAYQVALTMWRKGYIAGMDWTKNVAQEAFARVRAEA